MKILLVAINAKYIHSNLAVYCLKSYAAKRGIEVELTEYTINHRRDDILMDIYQRKPDVVAFSCYIWNLEFVQDIAADLYKVLPDLEIWGGGPEVSYDAEKFLAKHPEFRGIMKGEGERTFCELAGLFGADFFPWQRFFAASKKEHGTGWYIAPFALLCLQPCAAAVHIKVNFKPRGFYKVSTLYKKGAEPSGFPEALRALFRCQNRSSILSR